MPPPSLMLEIPPTKNTDAEDVVWGLQTADSLWRRGERVDALVWLRRAAQAAGDANDDDRALELARYAAELTDWMAQQDPSVRSLLPDVGVPPAPAAAAPPIRGTMPDFPPEDAVPPEDDQGRPSAQSVPPAEKVHAGMFDPWADNQPPPPPSARLGSVPSFVPEEDEEVITSIRPQANVASRSEPPVVVVVPPPAPVPSRAPPRKPPPLPPRARSQKPQAPPPPPSSEEIEIELIPSVIPPPPAAEPPAPESPAPAVAEPLAAEPTASIVAEPAAAEPIAAEPIAAEPAAAESAPAAAALDAPDAREPLAAGQGRAIEQVAEESAADDELEPIRVEPMPDLAPEIEAAPAPDAPIDVAEEPAAAPAAEIARAGVDLEDAEAFADLPEDARSAFAAAAIVHHLGDSEEVGSFALAYVIEGSADVAATMVDAPAVRLAEGAVLRARGTTSEGVPMRLIAAKTPCVVATWSDAAVEEAFRTCPWVEEDLRAAADRVQTLVGITIGPLGERLDVSIREHIVGRLTLRPLLPGEVVVTAGEPVPGLFLVGIGEIELVANDAVGGVVGSGDFLFPTEVLGAGSAPSTARAGSGGAVVLFGDRQIAQELLVTCPPLLEVFAGM
jgi:hypothetical protein